MADFLETEAGTIHARGVKSSAGPCAGPGPGRRKACGTGAGPSGSEARFPYKPYELSRFSQPGRGPRSGPPPSRPGRLGKRSGAGSPPTPSGPARAGTVTERQEGAWRVLPLEGTFELVYEDGQGAWSARTLRARELKLGPGRTLLGGIDGGRGGYRGFRVDRIRRLTTSRAASASRPASSTSPRPAPRRNAGSARPSTAGWARAGGAAPSRAA